MWLLKPPRKIIKVCLFCGGPFGLTRPTREFCSVFCVAWAENEKKERLYPPDELVELLKYPP